MIKQLIYIVGHFVVIQVCIFHNNTFSHKVTLEMRTACHYDLLELVIEFDLPFVGFELDHFEIADAMACEVCC